jgi:hypothetical protein
VCLFIILSNKLDLNQETRFTINSSLLDHHLWSTLQAIKAVIYSCIKLSCTGQFNELAHIQIYLWLNIALWERMLWHQRNQRLWNPPNVIDSFFVLLICITRNTQVSIFSNSHFWPTSLPFLSSALSRTWLILCSLSLSPSFYINSPLCLSCCNFT